MSNDLSQITSEQLKKAIRIKEQIEALNEKLSEVLGSSSAPASSAGRRAYRISPAGRAKIRAAVKARWAKVRGGKPAKKGRRKMSAAGRARISAAAKLRWKAAKAAGKSRL